MEPNISKFENLLKEVQRTKKPVKATPHDALAHFNVARRGPHVLEAIRKLLASYDVISSPDITTCWIYSEVTLSAIPTVRMHASGKSAEDYDPVLRLNILDAANIVALKKEHNRGFGLIKVCPDDPVESAIAKMLLNDFSQLPVMTSDRDVKGLISWKSIGTASRKTEQQGSVSEYMVGVEILEYDIPLFQAVKIILEKDVVLVKQKDKTISGIVTVTDLASKFIALSEPFLLIEQVEKHLRKLLDGKFAEHDLRKLIKTPSPSENIGLLSDLSFGHYVNIVANPDMFKKLGVNVDRSILATRLDEVRRIRNDVMHFEPDPISAHDLEILNLTVNFFNNLHA